MLLTLCLIFTHDRILLGLKKRGFGVNFWNGFGGKVQPNETLEQACHRELKEETGLTAQSLSKCAILDFWFEENPDLLQVHVFHANNVEGIPQESEEMSPKWFSIKQIPYDQMWPDDQYWLPLVIRGEKLYGQFYFRGTSLLRYHLKIQEDTDIIRIN